MQGSSNPPTGYSHNDVQALLRELRDMPQELAMLFAAESEETLHHHSEDDWSAVEIVAHLADHDAFERSQRFEVILSEDNPELPGDDTRFEVARSNYQALSGEEALDFFRRERSLTVALLERLCPDDWMRTGIHPNDGECTLLHIADLRGHDREHFNQVVAIIAGAKK